jgi:predicted flap endonuclease-1-like 5' DNA nuclease
MTFDTTTIILIVAIVAGLALILIGLRVGRRQRIERRPEDADAGAGPYVANRDRPYLKPPPAKEGAGVADEVAHATTDVAGEVLGVAVKHAADGPADDLLLLKGVGPKFVQRLNELGITRFDQLAGLNGNEVVHLDERLGPFQGRLARDRVVEQADYLARGDTDGFEEKFGKLGG